MEEILNTIEDLHKSSLQYIDSLREATESGIAYNLTLSTDKTYAMIEPDSFDDLYDLYSLLFPHQLINQSCFSNGSAPGRLEFTKQCGNTLVLHMDDIYVMDFIHWLFNQNITKDNPEKLIIPIARKTQE